MWWHILCVTSAFIWFITCLFFRHISDSAFRNHSNNWGEKMALQHSGTKRRHSNNVFDLVTPSEYPLSPLSFSFQRWMFWPLGGFLPHRHVAMLMFRLMRRKDLESAHSNKHVALWWQSKVCVGLLMLHLVNVGRKHFKKENMHLHWFPLDLASTPQFCLQLIVYWLITDALGSSFRPNTS